MISFRGLNHSVRGFLSCLLLGLLLCCSVVMLPNSSMAAGSNEIESLTFGIIPTDSVDQLKEYFEPFAKALSDKMGMPIETRYASDYAGIIEAMRFDKVDFAWYGNKSAMEAVDRAGAEVFCQQAGADGSPGYWSHIIVHKDSPYETIDQIIKNGDKLVFGNGDPNSTSGYLVPSYYIWAKRGIIPRDQFKEVRNSSHEANCLAVARKQVDFATNNNKSLQRFSQNHPELAKNIKVVWQSPLIPNDPICWRKDLPREVKSELKAAFLAFGRFGPQAAKEQEILLGISSGWAPFYNSDNRQLLPIRQLELVKNKMKLAANEDLSDKEKQQRIAAIDRQLEDLVQYSEMVQKY